MNKTMKKMGTIRGGAMCKKTLLTWSAALAILFGTAGSAGAQAVVQGGDETVKPAFQVEIDGQAVDPGIIYASPKGTSMAPSRWLADLIGAELTWNAAKQTVEITKDGHTIVFSLGQASATLDGQPLKLGDAPIVYRNTTYLPIKEMLLLFQYEVNWVQETKTIQLKSPAPERLDPQIEARLLNVIQQFVEYTNKEDAEQSLASLDPNSQLHAAFSTAIADMYEELDLVTELEAIKVLEVGKDRALIYTKERTENTNDAFHLDSLQEIVYTLVLNEQQQWKISDVQIQSIEYLNVDQIIKTEVDAPAVEVEKIKAVYELNEKASNEEDFDLYVSTIHPDSVGGIANQTVQFIFLTYDLEYTTSEMKLVGFEGNKAYLYTITDTKKIAGPQFNDVRSYSVHELKKTDEGEWKLYNTYIVNMEPLSSK